MYKCNVCVSLNLHQNFNDFTQVADKGELSGITSARLCHCMMKV